MSNYHRIYSPGGIYFFTLVTHERKPILCTKHAITRLRAAFEYVMHKHPFKIEGIVILPDHLHCIWQLPEADSNFSIRWNMIKRYFSISFEEKTNHRREKNIWQRRFWEHLIRDEEDFNKHLNYIYYNPVKHHYVKKPLDWPYSSFKRDVARGIYEAEWGSMIAPEDIQGLD